MRCQREEWAIVLIRPNVACERDFTLGFLQRVSKRVVISVVDARLDLLLIRRNTAAMLRL